MAFQDLLMEQCVLTDVVAGTKEDALQQICECFTANGKIKPTFYKALLERESKYPTGLELGSINVAIPHVVPEHVESSALAVAILKEPVRFARMDEPSETIDVRVIFCIALAQEGKQLETLQTLMKIVGNEETLQELIKAKSKEEIITILRKAAE